MDPAQVYEVDGQVGSQLSTLLYAKTDKAEYTEGRTPSVEELQEALEVIAHPRYYR